MKLLDKQTILKAKSLERKSEVDEGAKLARKVDLLRETVAKEEANLAIFRTQALAQVRKDIDALTREKIELAAQIQALNEQRQQLQIPLDDQWDIVKKRLTETQVVLLELSVRQASLDKARKEVESKDNEVEVEKARVEDLKRETIRKFTEADDYRDKAKETLNEAKDVERSTLAALEKRKKGLDKREIDVAYRETDVANVVSQIEKDKEWIRREKVILIDRQQTLERALNRIKKK